MSFQTAESCGRPATVYVIVVKLICYIGTNGRGIHSQSSANPVVRRTFSAWTYVYSNKRVQGVGQFTVRLYIAGWDIWSWWFINAVSEVTRPCGGNIQTYNICMATLIHPWCWVWYIRVLGPKSVLQHKLWGGMDSGCKGGGAWCNAPFSGIYFVYRF